MGFLEVIAGKGTVYSENGWRLAALMLRIDESCQHFGHCSHSKINISLQIIDCFYQIISIHCSTRIILAR
jgi:hypothetical protein